MRSRSIDDTDVMVPIQSLIDAASRGPLATGKPLIFGMIQRGGKVVLRMLDNVQPRTSKPLIRVTIALGTVYTGAYSIKIWQRTTPLKVWVHAILTGSLRACSPQDKCKLPSQVPRA